MENLSSQFVEKSVQATIAAIEVYNKPNFYYREESFSLLMTNAWELLLKAKWLFDNGENVESLYDFKTDGKGNLVSKKNRSGNSITFGLTYLAAKLLEDPNSALSKACHNNILGLIEIRDNSTHFINKDLYFGRKILEIGTASIQNYMNLIEEWFQYDLSQYNFFLMPISFYHGFEAVKPVSVSHYSDQMNRLLKYLEGLTLDTDDENDDLSTHQVALRMETHLIKSKDISSVAFKWSDDPNAPTIIISEEDFLKNYPWTFDILVKKLRRRYDDFLANNKFHKLKEKFQKEKKYSRVRFLNPDNHNSQSTRRYNPNILKEFDKHYTKRKK